MGGSNTEGEGKPMNTNDLLALADRVEAGDVHYTRLNDYFQTLTPQYVPAVEAYEGSLDAAQALHDAVLPGYGVKLQISLDGKAFPAMTTDEFGGQQHQRFSQTTASLAAAWVAAILRAKASQ